MPRIDSRVAFAVAILLFILLPAALRTGRAVPWSTNPPAANLLANVQHRLQLLGEGNLSTAGKLARPNVTSTNAEPPRAKPPPNTTVPGPKEAPPRADRKGSPRGDGPAAPPAPEPEPLGNSSAEVVQQRETMFRRIATNNTVFVLVANAGFLDFAYNAAMHFHKVFANATLLVANIDQQAYDQCRALIPHVHCAPAALFSPPCTSASVQAAASAGRIRSRGWNAVVACKYAVMMDIVAAGHTLFWVDADIAMLRSPWDFLPMRTLWEGACEMRAAKVRNTGLFAMRPGVASLWVLKSVVQHMIRNPDDFDQKVFNKYADRKRLPSFCLSHALDGYGCSRKHWERGGWRASVWALHPTCQIGHSGKKTWLVNHDAWLVPENVSRAMQP